MRRRPATWRCLGCCLLWALSTLAAAADPAARLPAVLGIGVLAEVPDVEYPGADTAVFDLAPVLDPLGVRSVVVVFADSNERLAQHVREGRVHWLTVTAANAARLAAFGVAVPMLRERTEFGWLYRTAVFVRADSPLRTLDDLVGHRLALRAQSSTTGFFEPVALLLERGYRLVHLRDPRDAAPAGAIGFAMLGTFSNVNRAVDLGRLDAGVNRVTADAQVLPQYRVLAEGPDVPAAYSLAATTLAGAQRELLARALVEALASGRAREAFDALGIHGLAPVDAGDLRRFAADQVRHRRAWALLEQIAPR